MSDTAPTIDFERLLAHREWVRAVARSLAADAATADDLEQETWLEALRAPPRNDRNLRGWLGRVVRNRARKRGRSGARRAHHERRADRTFVAPPAAQVVSEAEAQQRVVEAVLDLDEPYRTTILLRFYEGLPPREIGARMNVSAETVRTRVRRAGARLRDALGGGGLLGWTAIVFPLIGFVEPSRAVAIAAGGALAVETKKTAIVATLAGLLIGGVCALVMSLPLDPPAVRAAPPTVAHGSPESAAAEVGTAAPVVAERTRRVHVEKQPSPVAPIVEEEVPNETPGPSRSVKEPDRDPPPKSPTKGKPDKKRAKIAAARAAVREAYEGEKRGGFTTHDLAYWVDVKKLDDSRWTKIPVHEPHHDRGLQLRAKWADDASAERGMTIDVLISKLRHYAVEGGQRTDLRYPFDNLGEAVATTDVEDLINGFYGDWRRGANDVVENRCRKPRKCKFKVPKYEAAATVTDPETDARVRREWYVWSAGKQRATYVIEIRYGTAVVDRDALLEKGPEFVKNLQELRDKRVRWLR